MSFLEGEGKLFKRPLYCLSNACLAYNLGFLT